MILPRGGTNIFKQIHDPELDAFTTSLALGRLVKFTTLTKLASRKTVPISDARDNWDK